MSRKSEQQADRLAEIIGRFAGRRVLVAGDVILDRYVWGDVERTSPEAPVPVVRLREQTARLGGAANVVSNLRALGAKASLVGVTGSDEEAGELREMLKEIEVSPQGLTPDRGRPTTVKTRIMSLGQQLLRMDREECGELNDAVARRVMNRFERRLASAEVVLLSDYAKGVLCDRVCREMIALARKAGKVLVVDPKGTEYEKYRGASLIKPNKKEAEAATGIKIESLQDLERAAKSVQRRVGSRAVMISRGGEGVSVFERRRAPVHLSAEARAVFDVTGAGDSFIATTSLALAAGGSMAESAQLGNLAGSIVVGKLGAATAAPAELLGTLQSGGTREKLRSANQMLREIEALRAAGRKIVMTNGCFDLIHLGHIKFLEQARRLGDVLIVALNSDRSVREVKGPPRPVLDEKERAALIGSLDAVDYVVIFDEPTPERLLKLLRPDVLVKGKGLRLQQVVGRSIVKAYGGRVELLPLLGEMVTEAMIGKIAGLDRS